MEIFSKILTELSGYLFPVKVAKTVEEKQAVYRFRYKIYVEVMNMRPYHADHINKIFSDNYDDDKNTVILYLGNLSKIIGTITLRIWERGAVPEAIQQKFDLKLIPNIDEFNISELAYFMIDPAIRGKLIPLSFIKKVYDYKSTLQPRMDLMFCSCMPGLVTYYEKLGLKAYSNKFIQVLDGLLVPMVTIPYCLEYLKKMSAPYTSLAKKYALPNSDREKYKNICSILFRKNDESSVITSPQLVEKHIHSSQINADTCELLSFLSMRDLAKFCKLIIKVPEGMNIINKGTDNKEIYIVLGGKVDILVNERHVKTLGKGEVFGEMAFFTKQGRRMADTFAVTPVILAVIRKNDINRAIKKDKELALRFLYGISRILCNKLTDVVENLSQSAKRD